MPSPRKRIGFLPGVEVQEIIDNICLEKGLSQSKVTGLLVEEALKNRGLYVPKLKKEEFVERLTKVIFSEESNSQKEDSIHSNEHKFNSNNTLNKDQYKEMYYTQNEFDLLKEYLEFKRFKYMMSKVNEEEIG